MHLIEDIDLFGSRGRCFLLAHLDGRLIVAIDLGWSVGESKSCQYGAEVKAFTIAHSKENVFRIGGAGGNSGWALVLQL